MGWSLREHGPQQYKVDMGGSRLLHTPVSQHLSKVHANVLCSQSDETLISVFSFMFVSGSKAVSQLHYNTFSEIYV